MKRIVYQTPDGQVHIVTPAYADRVHAGRSADEILALALARLPAQASNPQVVDDTAIPTDRSQRHRWRLKDGKVMVDQTVPDPAHPKQAIRDAIEGATTLAQLKAAIKNLV